MQTVIEAAKAKDLTKSGRPVHTAPRASLPVMRQLTFDWKMQDKYNELNNFNIEVGNIFMTAIK